MSKKRKIAAMVDDRNERADTAHSLTEATSQENYLESYAAINAVDEHSQVSELAYQFFLERGEKHGTPEGDWLRAEEEMKRRNSSVRQGGALPE